MHRGTTATVPSRRGRAASAAAPCLRQSALGSLTGYWFPWGLLLLAVVALSQHQLLLVLQQRHWEGRVKASC